MIWTRQSTVAIAPTGGCTLGLVIACFRFPCGFGWVVALSTACYNINTQKINRLFRRCQKRKFARWRKNVRGRTASYFSVRTWETTTVDTNKTRIRRQLSKIQPKITLRNGFVHKIQQDAQGAPWFIHVSTVTFRNNQWCSHCTLINKIPFQLRQTSSIRLQWALHLENG